MVEVGCAVVTEKDRLERTGCLRERAFETLHVVGREIGTTLGVATSGLGRARD